MNCWNTLRASQNHNVAGNGKRDGMRICRIGQSAAKSLQGLEPTNMSTKSFYFFDLLDSHDASPTRENFMAFNACFSLQLFPLNEWKNIQEQVESEGVVKNDFVRSFTGFKLSGLNISICVDGNEFDSLPFAHSNLNDYSELKPMWSFFGGEFTDTDTSFSINNSGDICGYSWFHNSTSRLTFNDYPYGEYSQVAGRMQQSHHTICATGDIVFSSVKAEAARIHQSGGSETNESARKNKAYTGDDYYALAWPTTFRNIKNQLETIHQYTEKGFGMIMNGEIGRYENTRYIEQTNIPKGGAADSTTWNAFSRTADAWNGANSDWIYFFGADTVAEAIAVPEEMRGKIPTDFGRSRGVAWYYLGGFGIVHPVVDQANARIIKWDSAS